MSGKDLSGEGVVQLYHWLAQNLTGFPILELFCRCWAIRKQLCWECRWWANNQQLVAGRNLGSRQSMQGFQREQKLAWWQPSVIEAGCTGDLQREMRHWCREEALGVLISMSSVQQEGYCQAARLLKDHISGAWQGRASPDVLTSTLLAQQAAAQQSRRAPSSTKSLQSPPLRTLNIGLTLKEKHWKRLLSQDIYWRVNLELRGNKLTSGTQAVSIGHESQ